jgi:MFS family permease
MCKLLLNLPSSKQFSRDVSRTLIVGVNSTSITAAATPINQRFGISDVGFPNSFWPVTAWNGGAALAPMVVLPIMEKYGMRTGYLVCYVLFTIFVVPQALAPNFATLIVCRFIAGCCGGVLQDVMDGMIADVWAGAEHRSLPVTIYVFSLLAGVTLGPVIGGAIVSTMYWRW